MGRRRSMPRAVVSATDVRPVAKEQVQSLGTTFVFVESEETKQAETAGGYAKEMSDEFKQKQAALIAETVKKQDIVICTALIPGRAAPKLISEEMLTDFDSWLGRQDEPTRNSINQVNLSNFLKAAAPVFNASFAPVKIVVAGSICDLLTDTDYPFVELRGRVDSVDEFYAQAGNPEGLVTELPDGQSIHIKYFPLSNGGSIATHICPPCMRA